MPGTPKKRGRPRKYGTLKDKAKHDVVAKRARRRLRKQTTHDSIRFQIYVSSQTEASPVTPSQGIESYETSLLGDPPEADSSLNRAESPTLGERLGVTTVPTTSCEHAGTACGKSIVLNFTGRPSREFIIYKP
ncbi:hypothetical protein F53441_14012 [Fusarium austroafricanum]|uniref:Uncharacterized protein n=1 Tax=Fusarium austroafricanum TaxID=2364996 RepID=A0A8H4JI13_9HYPO|nr:hypothetical protein F53441_14012 [Fusarium austroafricanum]